VANSNLDPDGLPFASLVIEGRRALSLSQDDLAKRINRIARAEGVASGSTRQSVNRYERGKVIPQPDMLRWMAKALGEPVTRIVVAADAQRYPTRRGQQLPRPFIGPSRLVSADVGLDVPWSFPGLLTIIEDWLLGGLMDRRAFLAISGSVLAGVAHQYLSLPQRQFSTPLKEESVGASVTDQIRQSILLIRTIDDTYGGASHLRYAGAQFQALALLLRDGGYTQTTRQQILVSLAELAQQAGWMAYDASQQGLAQRYYLTGLRTAREAGDRAIAAHILADLSFQAASLGESRAAIGFGEAALRAATGSTPSVRASVIIRLSYASACDGRLAEFDHGLFEAQQLASQPCSADDPDWMYYLTPSHIDAQAGYALIHLARKYTGQGEPDRAKKLFARGQALLQTGAHSRNLDHPQQRRALLEGAWLALAYSGSGDSERACSAGRMAMRRLGRVRSPRSGLLLQTLARDLRRRPRDRYAREFLPDLDAALSLQVGA
jgi:transcriptional regulator with XRE-family HTH domain